MLKVARTPKGRRLRNSEHGGAETLMTVRRDLENKRAPTLMYKHIPAKKADMARRDNLNDTKSAATAFCKQRGAEMARSRRVLNVSGAKSSIALLTLSASACGMSIEPLTNSKGFIHWVVSPEDLAERAAVRRGRSWLSRIPG